MSRPSHVGSGDSPTAGYPELTVLMALTAGAIVACYVGVMLAIYPLVGVVDLPVYVGFGVAAAAVVSWGLTKYQLLGVRRGAHRITPESDPRLHEAVESMSATLGMDAPELYLVEADEANARAIGTRWDGAIVLHSGLYELLDPEELDAIAGHELAHLYYCDSLVTVASMHVERLVRRLAWVVAALVNLLLFAVVLVVATVFGESDRQAKRRARVHRLITRICVGAAGLVVLVPRNGLSRYREFVADRTAARLLGRPEPMIRALERLDRQPSEEGSPLDPINAVETRLGVLYATHPSIERRIELLRDDAAEPAGPTDPGPVLGTGTRFGLTAAPMIIVVGYAGLCWHSLGGAVLSIPGTPLALIGTAAGLLFCGVSLLAFPWAMLFGAGGNRALGLVAACSLGAFVAVAVGASPVGVLGVVALAPLAAVAGVQLLAIGGELLS